MKDERESLELAPRETPAGDLPQPPPLRATAGTALFLDFDGTLVEIVARPDYVRVARTLPMLIENLSDALGGRLALVSGRALEALDRLLGPIDVSMAGSHGGEFRPAGSAEIRPLAEPLPDGIALPLGRFARHHGELLVERKPFSIAVHYRDHPAMREPLLAEARQLAAGHGAGVKDGKMVVEVVMPGSDKGNAIARFMDMPPFAGTRPYFVGDDVTDEDAFEAVARFGGDGILVGAMRQTAAHWRLDSVQSVHAWLNHGLASHAAGETGARTGTGVADGTGERGE